MADHAPKREPRRSRRGQARQDQSSAEGALALWRRSSGPGAEILHFLHEREDFGQLLAVVADAKGLDPMLAEKDYWIMHCLWGLQAQGFRFELKGGTSL